MNVTQRNACMQALGQTLGHTTAQVDRIIRYMDELHMVSLVGHVCVCEDGHVFHFDYTQSGFSPQGTDRVSLLWREALSRAIKDGMIQGFGILDADRRTVTYVSVGR
jgi:hypothetical protein